MNTGYKIILILTVIFGLLEAVIMASIVSQNQITPNDEFFVVSLYKDPEEIDADLWRLGVGGLVAEELSLTYENITSFPSVSEIVTLRCVDGPTGTADWKGVRLRAVLDMAGVLPNATEVVFRGADGYSSSITLDYAMRDDVILAYEMNGEVLPEEHGFPLRLVAPGKYGYKWVKWITEIELVGHDYRGYWESRGWSDDATILLDWGPHAMVLTLSAYIGSLSLVAGLRFSKRVEFGLKLPSLFSRKFHLATSGLYYTIMLGASMWWAYTAFDRKGAFPSVPHGYLALIVMILAVLGIVSGLLMKRFKGDDIRLLHFTVNILGYLLILGTIFTGLIIGGIII